MRRGHIAVSAGLAGAGLAFAAALQSSSGSDAVELTPMPVRATPAFISEAPVASAANAVGGYDWSQVEAAIQGSSVRNLSFTVGDANGPLYSTTKGTPVGNTPSDLASASKWLVGILAMRMVQAGVVSLDDHPQKYLTFASSDPSDPRSGATLGQLLSLQGGFNTNPAYGGCVQLTVGITLQDCARTIYQTKIDYSAIPNAATLGLPYAQSAPGTLYSYGPYHLHVAAAMLEKAGGRPFPQLFRDYVTTPLGLTQTRYVVLTEPTNLITSSSSSSTDPTNPWVAGGAESTVADYAKLLRAMLGNSFITDMDEFTRPRTLGVPRGYVPPAGATWEYALGSWVECTGSQVGNPARTDCAAKVNSSQGAYGWLGWIDRSTGYYALIAAHTLTESSATSVVLEQRLQCEIKYVLSHPNAVGSLPPSGCAG